MVLKKKYETVNPGEVYFQSVLEDVGKLEN